MTPGQLFPCPGEVNYLLGQRIAPVFPPDGVLPEAAPDEGGELGWFHSPVQSRAGVHPDHGPWVSFRGSGPSSGTDAQVALLNPDQRRTLVGVEFSGGGRATGYVVEGVWLNASYPLFLAAQDLSTGMPTPYRPAAARGVMRLPPTLVSPADTLSVSVAYVQWRRPQGPGGPPQAAVVPTDPPQVRLVYAPVRGVAQFRRPGRPPRRRDRKLPPSPRQVPRRHGGMNGPPAGLGQAEHPAEPFASVALPLLIAGAVVGYAVASASKGSKK